MALTQEDVAGIAAYARIALDERELEEMTTYLNDAVDLLRPLTECDLEGVPATYHPIGALSNVVAPDDEDAHGRSLDVDTALVNAASTQGSMFRVPSIMGKEGTKADGDLR